MKTLRVLLVLIPVSVFAQGNASPDLRAAAQRALARVSGEMHLKGLHSRVEVLRDRWGVPHIYAQDPHDLFFAQGMVAAQDRLFQMELWKRAGQGRLAEILGPSSLARDVSARALRYRGDMPAEYASYAPDTQEILRAFTDGINAYIESLRAPEGPGLPVEFALAGFVPEAWHPQDCLNRMAAYAMTGNAASELQHAQAVADFGAERAAKLFALDPAVPLDVTAGMDLTGLTPDLLQSLVGSDQRIEFPPRAKEGSNNWTISGALTESGKPLLANDPHRVIGLPSLRYMVHLVAPGWNVIGAGEPGLPGVALGHNEQVAWGFTIFGLDQQDLYVEELDPANPLRYKTETGWSEMETRRETFHVRGAKDLGVELKFTRHGPVLWADGKRALALRWVGNEAGTAGYLASLAIDRAKNWDEFEAAVGRWKVPSENLVYADVAGNIGEHSAGLAPIRNWTGLLPVPGNSTKEWTGFVPAEKLPHSFNPKEGFVATANHKMIPENYPYNVGFEWTAGYRFRRIRAVIEDAQRSGHKLSLADIGALQNDVTSLPAQEFQSLVARSALKEEPSLSDFLKWDGLLTRGSKEAALYEVWLRGVTRKLGQLITQRWASARGVKGSYGSLDTEVVLRLLANPDKDLFGTDPIAARDQLLAETLKAAQTELAAEYGDAATWGMFHQVKLRHPLDRIEGAKDLLDLPPRSRPGDENTVNATWTPEDSWDEVGGASYREILDTADWDRSVAVNSPGQSGQPGSLHYSDLLGLWDTGQYFPLVYSRKAVEKETRDRLLLKP